MKQKPITPYARLLDEFKTFCDAIDYRSRITMFLYPKKDLDIGWNLSEVYQRTKAAETLGYDVVITADDDDGLCIKYSKKIPQRPWSTK